MLKKNETLRNINSAAAQLSSAQLSSSITLNFFQFYVYSLGIYLINKIYFLIHYFYISISQILKFQRFENCIFTCKKCFL